MKKLLKVLGVLLLLVLGALIAIPVFFKDDIVKIVKKEANAAVNAKIDFGDFELSLIKSFPDFYLSMNDISVFGVENFDSLELANVKKLNLIVDLMSVINGEAINVKQVLLIEPKVHAKILADGSANYLIAKEDTSVALIDTSATSSTFKLELQKVEIINGSVIYEDQTLPLQLNINKLNLDLIGDFTENITNIVTEGEIGTFDMNFDGIQYISQAKVLLDVIMEMNLEEMKFTFKENEIKLNDLPIALNGWLAMPNDPIDMDLTFGVKETNFINLLSIIPADFAKDLEGVETSGKLAFDGYAKGVFIDSTYPAFGVNLLVENARVKYPDLPKSVEDININAKIESKDGDLNNTIIDVPKFHFNMAQNPFDANLYLATPLTDPYIKAGVKGKLVLNNIKDLIPLEKEDELAGIINADLKIDGNLSSIEKEHYEDFKASGILMAEQVIYKTTTLDYPINVSKLDLEFTPKFLKLKQLSMVLGKSDFTANGQLQNFIGYALKNDQVLKGNLNLVSKLMDINELAGIDPSETKTANNSEIAATEPMKVVVLPKNINFVTNATVGKLIYDNVILDEVNGKVDFNNQKISLQNTSMKLLGGNMLLSGFYETTDSLKPTYDLGMDIKSFNLKQTLETFTSIGQLVPLAKFAKGDYSTNLTVKGALNDIMEPIFESIFGNGAVLTSNMQIEDYKPLEKISKLVKLDKINPLNINNQKIQFKLAEGKVFIEPFDMKIGETKLTIAGSNSFDQTIDYIFSFAIPRKEFGGALNSAADGLLSQASAKGIDLKLADLINIDINLTGPFTNPTIKSDLKKSASNATQALKDKAQAEIDKKKEELKQQAQAEIDKKKVEAEKRAQAEIDKQKQKAQQEIDKQSEEAKKKLEEEAKKKLKGLFGK